MYNTHLLSVSCSNKDDDDDMTMMTRQDYVHTVVFSQCGFSAVYKLYLYLRWFSCRPYTHVNL